MTTTLPTVTCPVCRAEIIPVCTGCRKPTRVSDTGHYSRSLCCARTAVHQLDARTHTDCCCLTRSEQPTASSAA